MNELLGESEATRYLRSSGIIDPTAPATVRALTGGVSNRVFSVHCGGLRLVVKQSLDRLLVEEEWLAPRSRTGVEATAMSITAELTPGRVPELVHYDGNSFILVMSQAPDGWTDWKSRLMRGTVEFEIARLLGETLSRWQQAGRSPLARLEALDSADGFEQLRVAPYYRTLAMKRPELATAINTTIDQMLSTTECFVHGDFSPKNMLTAPGDVWITDFEVAHVGDPSFDVAFMLSHLLLKAFRSPTQREEFHAAAHTFLDSYLSTAVSLDPGHLGRQLGCLLASRVDGKSPVEYLDEPMRERVRGVAARLLLESPAQLDDVWQLLEVDHVR